MLSDTAHSCRSAQLALRSGSLFFAWPLGHEGGHLTRRTPGLGASTPPNEHRDLLLFAPAAKYREVAQLDTSRGSARARAGAVSVGRGQSGAAHHRIIG
jgi:hypothetical protein